MIVLWVASAIVKLMRIITEIFNGSYASNSQELP